MTIVEGGETSDFGRKEHDVLYEDWILGENYLLLFASDVQTCLLVASPEPDKAAPNLMSATQRTLKVASLGFSRDNLVASSTGFIHT